MSRLLLAGLFTIASCTATSVERCYSGFYHWFAKFMRVHDYHGGVDRLSKYSHFVPLKSYYTTKVVADAFMLHIIKLDNIPKFIVSDHDKVFTSNFWQ